ncbi:unnamed protein product [Rotaria sordida]|uniref:Uncharacterized protein n=2 Tax=Rotaria sordida TaxID=392033 RepID=A0A819U8C3_9BILA|nr:unnamed protein product [Rotaria sordida]CAF4090702.1 unnamed protein product [Rotaria sordida]
MVNIFFSSPSSPYPSMVFTDNTITVFTDFLSIVSTTSPNDGLALVLAIHSAVTNDTQSSSQASSNLLSAPLEDVYPLHNNLKINTTITSTELDDMNRKSSSNVDCQKKSEYFSTKIVKKKALTCDSDDDSQNGINFLVDTNLHVNTRHKIKRKRRY